MEARLVIAYLLIAVLALGALLLTMYLVKKQKAHRKMIRGQGGYRKKA
ncbi:hypothetical protein GRI75_09945 [Altererythrobacter soli]|uniref:Uncharacterized protein n=1 Tax=Croceibacterium soli TaxID=1739690 RepID=A0A6I4USQ3_9SPHN|nr:hypothetical protein [Croceibacterium soli]MXP41960.1 hypothetical protein [Croceibacterium soli]